MHTVTFCEYCEVGPVVGEQLRTGGTREHAKCPEQLECLARPQLFCAKLHERRTSHQHGFEEFDRVCTRSLEHVHVDDRVESAHARSMPLFPALARAGRKYARVVDLEHDPRFHPSTLASTLTLVARALRPRLDRYWLYIRLPDPRSPASKGGSRRRG